MFPQASRAVACVTGFAQFPKGLSFPAVIIRPCGGDATAGCLRGGLLWFLSIGYEIKRASLIKICGRAVMTTSRRSGVWVGFAAAGLMASNAAAGVVSPEFYTRAGTSVSDAAFGLVTTDTGPTGSSSAFSVNPLTSVDWCSFGCVSTGDASASANLATGSLHARGGNTGNGPGSNGFRAASRASFGDTITFSNPAATASTLTTIGFLVHVHGVESIASPYENGSSSTFGRLSLSVGYAAFPTDWGAAQPVPDNVSPDFFSQRTWGQSAADLTDTTINQDISARSDSLGRLRRYRCR